MKTLWTFVSIVAIVNLLALLGIGGWFVFTGRIDRERWEAVKAVIEAPKEGEKKDEPKPEANPAEESRDTTPTGARISAQDRLNRQTTMGLTRLNDEREKLSAALAKEEQALQAREEKLKADRKSWDDATASARDKNAIEQFKKAVKILENVPPKQAKDWLLVLCADGKMDQAVAYLDAMSSYKGTSVMKALKGGDETKMAADLLEHLRQRTIGARDARSARSSDPSAKNLPNAPTASSTPAADGKTANNAKPGAQPGSVANAGSEPKSGTAPPGK